MADPPLSLQDVVYPRQCDNKWYEELRLTSPRCNDEIVSPYTSGERLRMEFNFLLQVTTKISFLLLLHSLFSQLPLLSFQLFSDHTRLLLIVTRLKTQLLA